MQKCSYITESNNNLKCLLSLGFRGFVFVFFLRIYDSSIFFETFPSQILKRVSIKGILKFLALLGNILNLHVARICM